MEYTISEVMPGQVVVEFADGSLAAVAVDPTFTTDDIDDAVSYYDPEFQPDPATLINHQVHAGEVRHSVRKAPEPFVAPAEEEVPDVPTGDEAVDYPSKLTLEDLARAQYYASQGDTRLLDAVYSYMEQVDEISPAGEHVEAFVNYIQNVTTTALDKKAASVAEAAEAEDIFDLAVEELENG